jgi:hypothetical protein
VRHRALALALFAACSSQTPQKRTTEPAAGGPTGESQSGAPSGRSDDANGGNSARGGSGGRGGDVTSGATNGGDADAEAGMHATGGAPPEAGGAGGDGNATCDFKVTWSLSENIPTVGIVEWTTALDDLKDASIEFGPDKRYGMTAPVDLAALNHRTLLVGMKPSHGYHFRIVARGGTGTCTSDDYTLATGPTPNGLPAFAITDHGGEHYSGFLLSSFLTTGPAFMLDADGDYVWAYGSGPMGRAALSHDGKYVWYSAINLPGDIPSMKRVTLDGLEETDFTSEFADLHHDFTLLPDDTIAFLAHHGDSDLVLEHAPDGTVSQVLDVGAVLGSAHTHANSLHYHPEDDSYTLGELAHDSYVKFGRDGHVQWILGGEKSDFTGDVSWDGQHGHRLLAPDRVLFFNNGPSNGTSAALELSLDLDAHTATRVWQYQPGPHCLIYGDVERLESGNTLVTFSTLGLIHEVTPNSELVREFTWDIGGALGYVTRLATPYPPFD